MELEKKNQHELLEITRNVSSMIDIHYIRQKEAKGLGHAIYCAKTFVGNEPFAVLLGDDVVYTEDIPCLKQMMDCYAHHVERFRPPLIFGTSYKFYNYPTTN